MKYDNGITLIATEDGNLLVLVRTWSRDGWVDHLYAGGVELYTNMDFEPAANKDLHDFLRKHGEYAIVGNGDFW